jgi:hypothetical protein
MIAYCRKHRIPVEASLKKPYSMDRNLLHISYEAGILEDPWFDPTTRANKAMFKLSVSPEDAPDRPEYVELDFEGRLRRGERQAADAGRRPPGAEQARRQARHRPRRPGREPLRRHEVARRLRDARRHDPHARPPAGRVAHDGPRGHAPARLAHPQVRRAGLLRLLVRPRARGAPGAGRREPEVRHRHGPAQALQGQRHHLRPQVEVLALRLEDRLDGGRQELVQPERRDRLHPAERPAAARAQPGAARAEGRRPLPASRRSPTTAATSTWPASTG